METNLITWGDGHKRYVKDCEKAEIAAYEKAFYFDDVKLNDIPIKRNF